MKTLVAALLGCQLHNIWWQRCRTCYLANYDCEYSYSHQAKMPPKKSSAAPKGNSASEDEDMTTQGKQNTELSDSLMTILQFLEKRDEVKDRCRREEEERRQEELERKEERRQKVYREEAEERERKLLALLESKEKAHQEHELRLLEKNKKLKSVPTWKETIHQLISSVGLSKS